MKLIERLQYHIQKLTEEKWDYTHTRNGVVEYVEDPKNDNSFRNYIKKDCENYARCVYIKGNWYFWPAKYATHDDFVRAMGLYSDWNKDYKLEVQIFNNGLELGFDILADWENFIREDLKELGFVSKDTIDIIKTGITLILNLHKRYNLKLSQKDLYRLKSLLANRKPASINKYDQLYSTDRWSDKSKIATKQHKHNDKSLPRKDRGSRYGYKWPNDPDKLDLDIDIWG